MASVEKHSVNLGVSALPEFSQKDYPELYVDAIKIRNGLKALQAGIDRTTGALPLETAYWKSAGVSQVMFARHSRVYAIATDVLTPGTLVNFHMVGTELSVRKAIATTAATLTDGFCTGTFAVGQMAEICLQGMCYNIGGLTTGTTYYTSNTAGLASSGAGTVAQRIGKAFGPTILYFRPDFV